MAKQISDKEYTSVFKLIEAGMGNSDIGEIVGRPAKSISGFRSVYTAVKNGMPFTDGTIKSFTGAIRAACAYLDKPLPEQLQPKTEAPVAPAAPVPAAEVKAAAPDNTALMLLKLLESVKSLDEHLCQLMDADLPRATEKIVTAIDATNAAPLDGDSIIKEIRGMSSVMAQTLRETITSQMLPISNIEKENRNTLTAIKNSVQRMERK